MTDPAAAPTRRTVVDEARNLIQQLDLAHDRYTNPYSKEMVTRIDFAIGATLRLRTLLEKYDEAVRDVR